MEKYEVGDIVEGTVTGIEDYGIFLSIDKDVSGLIHISEISDSYVKNVSNYAKINDIISAKVLSFDQDKKKLKLTIKELNHSTENNQNPRIKETGLGFGELAEALPIWIKEKEEELEKQQK